MLNREKRYIFYFFRENYNRGTNYQSLCLRPVSLLKSSDYIVLSDNPKTRASFTSSNCLYHNKVSERQVIWVPQTLYDHPHLHETVLDSVKKHVQSDLSTYQLVPYIVTKALREIGSKYKLKILGDSLEHVPSKDAIMNVHFSKKMLRTPPIFLVEDLNDILTTYGQAVEASNNPVFLLKCAHTQGGAGIFKIRSKKDLLQALQSEHLRRLKDEINVADASSYGAFSKFKLYFEQFIDNNLGTIVVTCFGDKMLCVTEQLQSTYTHIGNSFPISSKFKLNYEFLEMEVSTISKKFKLRGPWGMDLVASKDIDNSPIFYLVDINCGRFNGSHYPHITFWQYCFDQGLNFSCWDCKKVYFRESFDSISCLNDEIRKKNINASIVPVQLALYPGSSRIMVCGSSKEEIEEVWECCGTIITSQL